MYLHPPSKFKIYNMTLLISPLSLEKNKTPIFIFYNLFLKISTHRNLFLFHEILFCLIRCILSVNMIFKVLFPGTTINIQRKPNMISHSLNFETIHMYNMINWKPKCMDRFCSYLTTIVPNTIKGSYKCYPFIRTLANRQLPV